MLLYRSFKKKDLDVINLALLVIKKFKCAVQNLFIMKAQLLALLVIQTRWRSPLLNILQMHLYLLLRAPMRDLFIISRIHHVLLLIILGILLTIILKATPNKATLGNVFLAIRTIIAQVHVHLAILLKMAITNALPLSAGSVDHNQDVIHQRLFAEPIAA